MVNSVCRTHLINRPHNVEAMWKVKIMYAFSLLIEQLSFFGLNEALPPTLYLVLVIHQWLGVKLW